MAGQGTVLDVPLPPGVGDGGYAQVLTDLVWPLVERFRPDLILVSAGYDAHWNDPLAYMNLSLSGYAWLGRELVRMAEQLCEGRIVFGLEGGYQLDVLASTGRRDLHEHVATVESHSTVFKGSTKISCHYRANFAGMVKLLFLQKNRGVCG